MKRIFLTLLASTLLVSACQKQTPAPTVEPTPTTPAVVQTATAPVPTQTLEPLAAEVNGEGITVREFDAELSRLQAAQTSQGINMPLEEQRKTVLDELVGQTLLAQAARKDGFGLDEAALKARVAALAEKMGGVDALNQWQAAHGYTTEDFQASLARSIAADWQTSKISAEVGDSAEQVHARQILVFDQAGADTALSRLTSGTEFATLAYRYDPVTGGDLGWFPKGFLTAPEVEEAAFSLEPGQVSGIIKSSVGFHIIMVIEKEAQRPLSPEAQLALQQKALEAWLAQKISESQVEVFTP